MSEKNRYSDEELQEFKAIILEKLAKAQKEYDTLRANINNTDGNDIADTSPTFKILEEGATTLSKEEAGQLATRQLKFIQHLQNALIRIENKTYGVCCETGELIPKERLRAVPHATRSVDNTYAFTRHYCSHHHYCNGTSRPDNKDSCKDIFLSGRGYACFFMVSSTVH